MKRDRGKVRDRVLRLGRVVIVHGPAPCFTGRCHFFTIASTLPDGVNGADGYKRVNVSDCLFVERSATKQFSCPTRPSICIAMKGDASRMTSTSSAPTPAASGPSVSGAVASFEAKAQKSLGREMYISSIASCLACVVSNPFEVCKTRLQLQNELKVGCRVPPSCFPFMLVQSLRLSVSFILLLR